MAASILVRSAAKMAAITMAASILVRCFLENPGLILPVLYELGCPGCNPRTQWVGTDRSEVHSSIEDSLGYLRAGLRTWVQVGTHKSHCLSGCFPHWLICFPSDFHRRMAFEIEFFTRYSVGGHLCGMNDFQAEICLFAPITPILEEG